MEVSEFDETVQAFNAKKVLHLQKIKRPSANLKNVVLSFLTIFHDELDNLINEDFQYDEE